MKRISKKLAILFCIGIIAVTTSCKKDKNPENSWKVGDKSYKQAYGVIEGGEDRTSYRLTAADASFRNVLMVIFKSEPTAGTYEIVAAGESSLEAGEVIVTTAEGMDTADRMDAGAKSEGKSATVEIVGGKLKVTIPKVNAYYVPHGEALLTAERFTTIEGSIIETENPF